MEAAIEKRFRGLCDGDPAFIEVAGAVDPLIHAELRYEALRRLNIEQYKAIYLQNLMGYSFDALIDERIVAHAEEMRLTP